MTKKAEKTRMAENFKKTEKIEQMMKGKETEILRILIQED